MTPCSPPCSTRPGSTTADVETVTIGFDAVPTLLAGKLDAATAFWNAEGVTLARAPADARVPRRSSSAPPPIPSWSWPPRAERLEADRASIEAAVAAIAAGYRATAEDPDAALADLLAAVPGLDADEQRAQLEAAGRGVRQTRAPSTWRRSRSGPSGRSTHGIVDRAPDIRAAFDLEVAGD